MAENPVKKLIKLRTLRKRRTRAPGLVTAVDVDGQSLRVAQALPRGSRVGITRVAAVALEFSAGDDRSDPAVLGPAIAGALRELSLKPSSVVMGIPRAQVVLRTLILPVIVDVRELASVVHFQVGKDLPFRMEDAVIDFKVRRQLVSAASRPEIEVKPDLAAPGLPPPSPKLEVLVAAVKRDVVDFYQQTAAAAGLKLNALGLLSYANARCLDACSIATGDEAVALVSLRPDEMNIDVISQQTLLFSRGANVKSPPEPRPADPDTDPGEPEPAEATPERTRPENFVDAVTIEVVRSVHGYSGMEPNNPIAKIAVTGATGQEAAVVAALSRRVGRPCMLLDLAGALELSDTAREQSSGSIAAIGLALGLLDTNGLPFDFLNPKRPAVQRDLRRIRILAGIAAAAALVVFTLALRTLLINRHEKIRRDLAAEVAEADRKSPLYRQMIRQADSVDEWARGGRNWLEHYAYLTAILPPSEEIYATSLGVSGSGAIRLSVQSRSGEILAKLEKQLRAAGYDVKPLAITPGADRFGYEFRSPVELIVHDKMKIDLSKAKTPVRPADDGSLDPVLSKGGGG